MFENFKKFKTAVENKNGHHTKALRFDWGKEFTSKESVEVCRVNEIRRPLIVLRSPLQNDAEQRMSKTDKKHAQEQETT